MIQKASGWAAWSGNSVIFCLSAVLCWATAAHAVDDRYIEGYARALLDQEMRLVDTTVESHDGALTVRAATLGGMRASEMLRTLERIPGVTRVTIEAQDGAGASTTLPAGVAPAPQAVDAVPTSKWLPRGQLFEPLHADPRWPHFSLGYQRVFTSGGLLNDSVRANMGGTIPLYRSRGKGDAQWEVGVQAGSFSLFDLTSKSGSNDIMNTDFVVSIFHSYRRGKFSSMVRYIHQSSHLGDEFSQHTGTQRLEIGHDRVDVKGSYDIEEWLRVYGGGGVLVRQAPDGSGVGYGTLQGGVEFTGTQTYWKGRVRPVAYADLQIHQRTGWSYGHSLMVGVQFENLRLDQRAVQLLIEQHSGPFPDGQFYTQKAHWLGLGLHFYF
ncbi:MAG: DUF1207 domain-containing protein [Nitrospiraceae bacterium]